ncbi:hypothetical protein X753_20665 [Mesorhizobium sp. LNJC399B00]|nr:hypothetical protein X753_20665 [Mesorhizobium sp. LNJC399B00]
MRIVHPIIRSRWLSYLQWQWVPATIEEQDQLGRADKLKISSEVVAAYQPQR